MILILPLVGYAILLAPCGTSIVRDLDNADRKTITYAARA